jgi:poly(hydroxyalkanoate) depolymerase family esterase
MSWGRAGLAALTRFSQLAEAKGFIVVYPEQSKAANNMGCWNWFQDADVKRGTGEPSIIAGITRSIQQRYSVDPRRVYVAGLSAGGAMSAVMAATYPDLYAAYGVGSGCEYTAGAPCAGYQSADPEAAGQRAYQAMGSYARVVPFIAFQGDKDTTVPPINGTQLVRAGQVAADWADDGQANGSVPKAAAKTVSASVSGGRTYTLSRYSERAGSELAQFWLVHGMNHAWSGGDPSQQYADATGPNESAAMLDFFISHPMQEAGGQNSWPSLTAQSGAGGQTSSNTGSWTLPICGTALVSGSTPPVCTWKPPAGVASGSTGPWWTSLLPASGRGQRLG